MADIGRLLMIGGGIMLVIGLLLFLSGKAPGLGWLGRLPGDIVVKREGFTLYAPIATMLVVSLVLTLILNLIFRR